MAFNKMLTLLTAVVMVHNFIQAYPLKAAQETTGPNHVHHGHSPSDYYLHPRYDFNYAVHDPHTGDVKSQWESRDGDKVRGSYTVHDPDGTIRTVDYTADKYNGFKAVVTRVGKSYHPISIIAQQHGRLRGHSNVDVQIQHGAQNIGGGQDDVVAEAVAVDKAEVIDNQNEEEQNSPTNVQATQIDDGMKQPEGVQEEQGESNGHQGGFNDQLVNEQYHHDGSTSYLPLNYKSRSYSVARGRRHH